VIFKHKLLAVCATDQ